MHTSSSEGERGRGASASVSASASAGAETGDGSDESGGRGVGYGSVGSAGFVAFAGSVGSLRSLGSVLGWVDTRIGSSSKGCRTRVAGGGEGGGRGGGRSGTPPTPNPGTSAPHRARDRPIASTALSTQCSAAISSPTVAPLGRALPDMGDSGDKEGHHVNGRIKKEGGGDGSPLLVRNAATSSV